MAACEDQGAQIGWTDLSPPQARRLVGPAQVFQVTDVGQVLPGVVYAHGVLEGLARGCWGSHHGQYQVEA